MTRLAPRTQLYLAELADHELVHLRRKLGVLERSLTRAARGDEGRSATRLAKRLLRQLSEVR